MTQHYKIPMTPTMTLVMTLGLIAMSLFIAFCATPSRRTYDESGMIEVEARVRRAARASGPAIHCTHEPLSLAPMTGKTIGTRTDEPVTGPILPRELMQLDAEREGETQLTRQRPRDSHSGGPVPQPRTPSVDSSLPLYRSR
jgi:hypothetical protein